MIFLWRIILIELFYGFTILIIAFWILILWVVSRLNAERTKLLSFWVYEHSHGWWRAGISDSVCVCGSEYKLLRDNQTISPDGEEGQSEDIMNCQYRERGFVWNCMLAYLSYYFGSIHWEEITGSSATGGSQAKSGPSLHFIQPSYLILMKHWTSEHFLRKTHRRVQNHSAVN